MQFIISVLLSGIAVGGQYALIAIGYTMVYGILRLINFAHGDVFMVAGLMGIYFSATLPLYIALPLVLVMTVVLGFLIERLAYKPLRTAPRMSVMISAIGVSYFLQNTATYITGGQPMVYPEISWLTKTVTIAGTPTKLVVLITPVLVILLVLGLTQLINHTKVGMAMRAVSRDFETAQLMGIKINSVISVTFIIGSSLANLPVRDLIGGPRLWTCSVFRLLVMPAIIWAVFHAFVPAGLMFSVAVVLAGMPVATNGTMLCYQYGGNSRVMAQGTFVTTVLAMASIPLLVQFVTLVG